MTQICAGRITLLSFFHHECLHLHMIIVYKWDIFQQQTFLLKKHKHNKHTNLHQSKMFTLYTKHFKVNVFTPHIFHSRNVHVFTILHNCLTLILLLFVTHTHCLSTPLYFCQTHHMHHKPFLIHTQNSDEQYFSDPYCDKYIVKIPL